jgi:hypothetical protein
MVLREARGGHRHDASWEVGRAMAGQEVNRPKPPDDPRARGLLTKRLASGIRRIMDNIIRPTFGQPRRPEPQPETRVEVLTQRVYGEAGGCRVCLVHDEAAAEGDVYKVVAGLVVDDEVSTVAILPATPEGEVDAEIVALAILRTLGMLEARTGGPASA